MSKRKEPKTRYYLALDTDIEGLRARKDQWREVTKEHFVRAERRAGFRPKHGLPDDEPCTSGFSNGQVKGRVSYE